MGYKEEQAVLNTQIEVLCPVSGRDQRCKLAILFQNHHYTKKGEYKFKSLHKVKQNQLLKFGQDIKKSLQILFEILSTADIK